MMRRSLCVALLLQLSKCSGAGILDDETNLVQVQTSLIQTSRTSVKVKADSKTLHFIYTVGCDDFQLINSVALDHSWREVKNRGKLTRLVSGCKNKTEEELLQISPLSGDPDFAVFIDDGTFTSKAIQSDGLSKGQKYPAGSRPYAIDKWLQKSAPTEDVVVILDPDMVSLRAISDHPGMNDVRPGLMLAQQYAQGDSWIQFAQVGEATPTVSHEDAWKIYATGPPWAVDKSDLKKMLPDWERYTDGQEAKNGLMREQNAFNMAAYKHRIPSSGTMELMVSAPGCYTEAWEKPDDFNRGLWSPYVLHYDTSLSYKTWAFHKSLFSSGWYGEHFHNTLPTPITCGAPMLEEPPATPTEAEEPDKLKRQNAFMLAELIPRLSRAFKATRAKTCGAEDYAQLGLMRSMQPDACDQTPIGNNRATRHLVESASGKWDSVLPRGEDRCSDKSQIL